MSRLVSSEHALRALVALNQRPDGCGLRELARVVGLGPTSVQRALELLGEDGLVQHAGGREPFHLDGSEPAVEAAVALAHRLLDPREAIRIALVASRVPRFAGEDERGFLYVPRELAAPEQEVKLSDAIDAISFAKGIHITRVAAPDATSAYPRAKKMKPLVGSAEMLTKRRNARPGRPLGRLHPSLGRVTRGKLGEVADRLGIDRVVAFGSSVRSDFAPSSDLDLLVRAEPRLDLQRRLEAAASLEELFGRPVDVIPEERASASVLESAEREGVVLLGRK